MLVVKTTLWNIVKFFVHRNTDDIGCFLRKRVEISGKLYCQDLCNTYPNLALMVQRIIFPMFNYAMNELQYDVVNQLR